MKALVAGIAPLLLIATGAHAQSQTSSRLETRSVAAPAPSAGARVRVMMLRWFTSDVVRAEKFYQAVFGMTTVQRMGEKVRIMMFPGMALPGMILVQSDKPDHLRGSFVAQVSDVNATLQAAAANGGKLLSTRFNQEIDGQQARSSHFEDPDGNVVEVLQMGNSAQ
ncbi:VOC family protein [Novosphingobium sp. PS1R-30]|uniref:VOC family protein n=1 Tax=Novosphingobium anseongense TaxID=3133436 RepID=A0ABU8S1U1_9SPHN